MGALARMTEDMSVIPPSRRRNADRGDLRLYFGNARICLCVTFITASSSYTVSVGVPTFLVRGMSISGLDDGGMPDPKRCPRLAHLPTPFISYPFPILFRHN